MATSPGVVSTHLLRIDDLAVVFSCLEDLQVRWKRVGDLLGIKAYRIDAIKKEESTCEDRFRETIAEWLRGASLKDHLQSRPSWKSLSEAVEHVDKDKASNIIRDHQCDCDECLELAGYRSTPVGRLMWQGKTIDAAYALYEKFDDLVLRQAENFINPNIDVLKACVVSYMKHKVDHFNLLPPASLEIDHHLKTVEKYRSPKSIVKFLYTNNFINFVSHGLLKKVSKGDCLFLPDDEYQKDLSHFLHSTHLSSFPEIFTEIGELELHPPKGLPTLIIHLESKWRNNTMYDLAETLENIVTISFDSFILVNILSHAHHSSLDVVFAVWPCNAVSVVNDLMASKDTLTVNGVSIEFSEKLSACSGQQKTIAKSSQEINTSEIILDSDEQMTSLTEPNADVESPFESLRPLRISNEDIMSSKNTTDSETKSHDDSYSLTVLSPTSVKIVFKTNSLNNISKFEVHYSNTNGNAKTCETDISKKSITISNLNPNEAYNFHIKAFNDHGECIDSHPLSFNSLSASFVCDPPGKPYALNVSSDTIKLTWMPPNQDVVVKSYQISYGTQSQDIEQWEFTEADSNECIVDWLHSSTKYLFKVAAICKGGVSKDSDMSDPITTLGCPMPKLIPIEFQTTGTQVSCTTSTAALHWLPPPQPIDSPMRNYFVRYKASDNSSKRPTKRVFTTSSGTCTAAMTMLIADRVLENTFFSFQWKKTTTTSKEDGIVEGLHSEKDEYRFLHHNQVSHGTGGRQSVKDGMLKCSTEFDSHGVLMLKWDKFENTKHLIEVMSGETGSHTLFVDNLTMQNLPINVKHNTNYKICVSSPSTDTCDSYAVAQSHNSLPRQPEKPKLLKNKSNQISIEWNKQENVSFFQVSCYRPSGFIDSFSTTNSWCTFTNLSPETQYSFGVQAVNSFGKSEEAFSENISTIAFMSTSPKSFEVTKVSVNSVSLQWKVPEHNTDAVLYYSIRYKSTVAADDDDDWLYVSETIQHTFHEVQGLSEYTEYCFQVCAHFQSRMSKRAELFIKTKPSPPCKPGYKILENGDIEISWELPRINKFVRSYQLFWENLGSRSSTSQSMQISEANSIVVKRFQFLPDEKYVFKVKAVCDNGLISNYSECSEHLSVKRLPQVFGKPKAITCTATSIHLTWNAAKPHFQNICYKVKYAKHTSSKKSWQYIEATTESVCINDLTPNTSYVFKVKAKSMTGNLESDKYGVDSDHSDPIKTTLPPPTDLKANLHSLKTMKLKWNAPTESFSKFVTSYKVYIASSNASENWYRDPQNTIIRNTEAEISNLEIGFQYRFKVVAVFAGHQTMKDSESEPSQWIRSVYPIPSAPEKVTTTNITQDSVLLEWNEPNVNGEYVKSYTVYKKSQNDDFELVNKITQKRLEIFGLTPDTLYQFKIAAINSDGQGSTAESNGIKTDRKAPGPPGKPYMLRVTHNMVKVSWEKPMKHSEMVRRYQVFYKKSQDANTEWKNVITQSEDTEIEIYELEHSTKYLFKVRPLIEDGYFGRNATSEVSEVVEMKSALPSDPGKPKGETDVSGSITLSWTRPEENFKDISHYEIQYYQAEEGQSQPRRAVNGQTHLITTDDTEEQKKIDSLSPNQGYYFSVRAVTKRGEKSGFGLWSDLITNHKTLAAKVLPFCKYISEENDKIPIYLLPPGVETCSTDSLKIFENRITNQSLTQSHSPSSSRKSQVNKVLMLVGATGAGKSTLINAMINYIMRVEYGNHFRLKLIHEPDVSQTQSVTKFVIAYKILYESGFGIPYTLTIIDTPGFGDTAGLRRDKEITQQIKEFFSIKNGITRLDGIGFVCQSSAVRLTHTQRYIFDSIQAIFGNDVKNNIFILCTFCDGEEPQVIKAVEEASIPTDKHYKFNNSSVYSANSANKVTESFWEMSVESFKRFFEQLEHTKSVGIRRTKDVLQQRENLETYAIELKQKIQQGMAMITRLKNDTEALTKMKDNQSQEIEVEEEVTRNIDLRPGERANNCEKCNITCHYPCTYEYDFLLKDCNAMKKYGDNKMYCSVCPGLCYWKDHKIFTYRKEKHKEVVKKTFRSISTKYFNTMDHEATSIRDAIQHLKNGIDEKFEEIFHLVVQAKECNKQLDMIALLPNHLNDGEYINLLIEAQKSEKSEGYEERIQQYQLLKERAAIFEESGEFSLRRNAEGKRWWERHFNIGADTDVTAADQNTNELSN